MSAAIPQIPIWVGSQAITETPDSPLLERDATRFAVTRIYEGPYEQLAGNQPVQGQAFSDLPDACLVVSARLEKTAGGKGRLTVKAETSGPSDTQPYAPTYEVEWVEIDKKLEQHPRYGPSGAKYLTVGDRCALQVWDNEDDFAYRSYYQFKIPTGSGSTPPEGYTKTSNSPVTINGNEYDIYTLSTNASDFAYKKMQGEDGYRLWAPVVRQSIQSPTLPESNPCGFIEDPPAAANPPAGYVWQRSAQRATKTGRYGKWTQQQEWQGADYIDSDLYQTAE